MFKLYALKAIFNNRKTLQFA